MIISEIIVFVDMVGYCFHNHIIETNQTRK